MENELQLSSDINVITAEINSYKNVAGQAIFEIGRRLKKVRDEIFKEPLSKQSGQWYKFLNDIDIDITTVKRMIQTVEQFKDSATSHLPTSKIFEMLSLPSEIDRVVFLNSEHTVPSTGEQKTVDEMTVKELREVKKALKQAEEDKRKLERQLHNEKNKSPKIETKVIEKEIDNTDYESIRKLNLQLQQKEKSYTLLMNEKRALEAKMKLTEKENKEFQNLKSQIQNLTREKEDIGRQIQAATSISGLVVEINHLIKEKLAPIKYSQAIQEMQYDEIVVENLTQIIGTVQSWCNEMKTYLPNTRKIINMEVL